MHGPGSKEVDPGRINGAMKAKDFIDVLDKNGIELFSVTDHMRFNAGFYGELESELSSRDNMALIYGCEANVYVDTDPSKNPNKKAKKFQMGVYFPPEPKIRERLETTFKDLYGEIKEDGTPTKRPKLHDIFNELSKLETPFLLIPEANKKTGKIDDLDKYLFQKDLEALFKNMMYRVFNGYDSTESWSDEKMDAWAMDFLRHTDEIERIFGSLDEKELKAKIDSVYRYLKEGTNSSDAQENEILQTIRNYARDFCYFHFSDWHCGETYQKKCENYIYGSLGLPFDSIRMALADPFSRVQLLKKGEKIEIDGQFLKEVSFMCGGENQTIAFEPGLNAVVGKRASGKSMLLLALASLGDEDVISGKLAKYNSANLIDSHSISALTYGGTKISKGQLPLVELISQDSIVDIFEDPKKAAASIFPNSFPTLPQIDKTPFAKIVELGKKLKPYQKNYGAINEYLKADLSNSGLTFIELNGFDTSDYETKKTTFKNSFDSLAESVRSLSFSTRELEAQGKRLFKAIETIDFKISLFEDIVTNVNGTIKAFNDREELKAERFESLRKVLTSFFEKVEGDFNLLAEFKHFRYLVDGFNPALPEPKTKKVDQYVFVSYFKTDNSGFQLAIKEAIESSIDKRNSSKAIDDDGWCLFKQYMDGGRSLRTNFGSVVDSLTDSFWDKWIGLKNELYQIEEGCDSNSIPWNDVVHNSAIVAGLASITNSSPGKQSSAYLDILLRRSNATILLFDQPEDNIDNDYLAKNLVPMIKRKKISKQMVFVTHNPSIAVYADAFNYILADNVDGKITYKNMHLDDPKSAETIIMALDGGKSSFANRNRKYNDVIGEYEWKNR